MSWFLSVLLCLVLSRARGLDESNIHSDRFIQRINEMQDSWTAGRNFLPGSSVKNLLSALPMREESLPLRNASVRTDLPLGFDGRKYWKRCKSLGRVKEQGNCASAWALVAAGVLNDRICISKTTSTALEISAQNVLSCCKKCGTNCLGGYVTDALNFLKYKGAPSKKCHPYEVYGCPKVNGALNCPTVRGLGSRCRPYCRKPYPWRPFRDTRKSGTAYSLPNSSVAIMSEIVSHGPVAAVMDVYEDLLVYKSGVYAHTAGTLLAQHPVKVVGWGLSRGRPFWLIINTWSTLWGDKGVVRVARDTNGCNLENRVFALTP